MCRWLVSIAAVLFAAVVCAGVEAAAQAAWELPLTVVEPVGAARRSEPVSGGIPVMPGTFKPDQAFSLFDEKGAAVPLQALPLVVDEQGYLHWILLDFQTDLAPRERKTFTLRAVKGTAAPPRPVKVREEAGGVTVETGTVAFTIAADRPFGLFASATAGGRPVLSGGEVSYTDAFDGARYVADKPQSIAVEYAGPMRTTVCVKGRFVGDDQSKFLYVARITAWAGRSDVLVKYTLSNSNEDHYTWRAVKDSSVVLRLAQPAGGALLGASKPIEAAAGGWLYQGLAPSVAGGGKAGTGETELWSSAGPADAAQGWIAAKGPSTVQVADLYFVDDPARRLALAGGALTLTGVTERLDGPKDDRGRARGQPYADKVRWVPDCTHLSSFYVVDLAAPAEGEALGQAALRARGRLWCMAPPAWYFETESLSVGRFGTQADELKCYETWGWTYDPQRVPKAPGGYAIPRYIKSEDNHFETEEDIVESLLLMYLRTGGRAFFDATEAWANFHMDLQAWRTDGWRWKDGGVWWYQGPYGNRPQRPADPVTGLRNGIPGSGAKEFKPPFSREAAIDLNEKSLSKACYCHNWGEGMAGWFCLTGDRDALETALDIVEQNYDTQRRAFRKTPGQPAKFSRDFTRSSYLTNATRMVLPKDPFLVEASDYLAAIYLQRPNREPRGLVNAADPITMKGFGERGPLEKFVGKEGLAEMQRLGVTENPGDGLLTDPKSGATWYPIVNPNTWMFPPMSQAMECYYRLTGSEDAHDWVIAYGQAVAHVLYQRHGNQHGALLADFPLRGIVKDLASWTTAEDNAYADGIKLSGYLAKFHPDVAARAYSLSGDPFLKQRAHDYWFAGSHRGYQATKMHNLGGVGEWVNYYGVHSETVNFTGRTFYEWAHPRADEKPPAAVSDLRVAVAGDKATVTFTAPADEGGGKVVRYQVKASDKPIVDYEAFLKKFAAHQDAEVTNWWMAANLAGEPAPKAPGTRETFTLAGVPEGARYFAVCVYDDASNRSAMSNVAGAGR